MNKRPTVQEPDVTRLPPAMAVPVAELVSYAPGSTVSRILVQNKAGNVTLFSFDKGQELSEHTAPFHAFVQVLDGVVELTIGGKAVVAKAGETVVMPAQVSHALHASERFKMLLSMVRE